MDYPIPKTEHMLEHQLTQKSGLLMASEKLSRDIKAAAWKRSKDAFIVILLGMIGLVGLCLLVSSSATGDKTNYQSLQSEAPSTYITVEG